jgi:hypothetical protein
MLAGRVAVPAVRRALLLRPAGIRRLRLRVAIAVVRIVCSKLARSLRRVRVVRDLARSGERRGRGRVGGGRVCCTRRHVCEQQPKIRALDDLGHGSSLDVPDLDESRLER